MENILYLDHNEHPLDIIENLAETENYSFSRSLKDELDLWISSKNSNFRINFNWNDTLEGIHIAVFFDTKIPDHRVNEVTKLTIKINQLIWLGHFDIWTNEQIPVFRYNLLLAGGLLPTNKQSNALLNHIVEACEKFYPSFQYVIWGGNDADEAIKNAMFTTVGES